jgi:hypothetical protein
MESGTSSRRLSERRGDDLNLLPRAATPGGSTLAALIAFEPHTAVISQNIACGRYRRTAR